MKTLQNVGGTYRYVETEHTDIDEHNKAVAAEHAAAEAHARAVSNPVLTPTVASTPTNSPASKPAGKSTKVSNEKTGTGVSGGQSK